MLSDIAVIWYSGDSLVCDSARAVVIVAWRWPARWRGLQASLAMLHNVVTGS